VNCLHLLLPHVALSEALPHLDVEKRNSGISRRKNAARAERRLKSMRAASY